MDMLESDIRKVESILLYEAKLGGIDNPNKYVKSYGMPSIKINEKKEILVTVDSDVLKKFIIDWQTFTRVLHYLIERKRLPVKVTFQRDMVNQDEHFSGDDYTVGGMVLFLIKIPRIFIPKLDQGSTRTGSEKISIILYSGKDCLDINSVKISVPKETLERVLLDVLIDKDSEVSWDEIRDVDDAYSKEKTEQDIQKKKISDASRRLNQKIIDKTILKEKLIKQRRNNYSLTRKVSKK